MNTCLNPKTFYLKEHRHQSVDWGESAMRDHRFLSNVRRVVHGMGLTGKLYRIILFSGLLGICSCVQFGEMDLKVDSQTQKESDVNTNTEVVSDSGSEPDSASDFTSDSASDSGTESESDEPDLCPNDPNKTEPGKCGCGTADTDVDSDGIPDCHDACPDDLNKTEPGECGCGNAPASSDWYPDCDADGAFRAFPVHACGTTEANAAFNCEDGADPDGGWSNTAGVDCNDEDATNPCDCGEHDYDGDGSCGPYDSLDDIQGKPTGIVNFELTTGPLPLYVDGDYDSGGWVLIGRGREGWSWTEVGLGDQATLSVGLGTPTAFPPAYLSAAIVQELIDNTGIDLTSVEIRIKRAAAMDGSSYQETLWQSQANPVWTWLFDTGQYNINYTALDSVLGAGVVVAAGNTRDVGNNDWRRTFTWAWNSHNFMTGFSYGQTISIGTNTSDNFLWENAAENHSVPYSEVYIRPSPE